MTRIPGLDPEVLADLRLRDDSERDRSRGSLVTCVCGHHVKAHEGAVGRCDECGCEEYERAAGVIWSPPVVIERWPCTGCSALVDVTRDAMDLHAMFNRQLERRGERPLAKRIPCAICKARDEELVRAQRRPHQQTEMPGINHDERPSGMPTGTRKRR